MRAIRFRHHRAVAIGGAIVALLVACGGGGGDGGPTQVSNCQVVAAQVSPPTASVAVGDTIMLVVQYSTASICGTHPTVTWSASNTSVLSLQPDGEVLYVAGRTPSAQPVTITVKVGSVTATSQVTVTTGPAIKLTPDTLTFTAVHNGTPPQPQTVALTNGGGGTLSQVGPAATVYGAGANGWLFIQKSGLTSTAPYNLNLQPTNTTFAAGTYTATVPVTSPVASNSPQSIAVVYTITSSGPATPPTIANFVVTLVSVNSCGSGNATGNSFRASFIFTDAAGNAITGSVLESFVFHPSGISGNVALVVPSADATVSNGTINLTPCIAFGANTSLDLTVALQNGSGQTSNSLTANVPKPAGGTAVVPSVLRAAR